LSALLAGRIEGKLGASKRSLAASNAPSARFIAARASGSASSAAASLRRNSARRRSFRGGPAIRIRTPSWS
jgi:hypothetical protein